MTAQPATTPQLGGSTELVLSARSAGLRLGALFGPTIFGVTAAGVALPEVTRALDASPSAAAWVLTAHALALGIGTALAGRIADARGVRFILLAGAVALAVGAAICLTAPDLVVLVIGRLVLAAGSGATSAAALALAAAAAPEQRPRILATFGATLAVFSAGATLAGGVVTDWLSWRLTVVLPLLSLVAVPFVLRQAAARPGSRQPVDFPGAGLLAVTAASLLVLIQAGSLALPPAVLIVTIALVVCGGAALVLRVVRVPTGFVPRRLVGDHVFLRAMVVGVGVFAGLFGAVYAVPQLLVREHGWSSLSIGLWLLPGAIIGGLLSRLAGTRLRGTSPGTEPARSQWTGARVITATAGATAVLLGLTALTDGNPVLVIGGVSLAFAAFATTQVVTTGLLSAQTPPAQRGGTLALLSLTFFLGGALGTATAGTLARETSLATAISVLALYPLLAAVFSLTLDRPVPAPRRAT
jgi:DHA2 family metal-tetracycline-proton antiporter-like MFS transporter